MIGFRDLESADDLDSYMASAKFSRNKLPRSFPNIPRSRDDRGRLTPIIWRPGNDRGKTSKRKFVTGLIRSDRDPRSDPPVPGFR